MASWFSLTFLISGNSPLLDLGRRRYRESHDRVHVYELDEPTGAYAPTGIFRGTLQRPVPFAISLDLDKLTPPRSG